MRQHIENLIYYEIEHHVIDERDAIYIRNQLYQLFHLSMDLERPSHTKITYPSDALEPLIKWGIDQSIFHPIFQSYDQISAHIMNLFAMLPSRVEQTFYQYYAQSKASATNWYYQYMQHLNYIQMDRIHKNKHFNTLSIYGHLEITINKSKPEKNPLDIIQSKGNNTHDYPQCALCVENEGYQGDTKRDPKSQHRMIKISLDDENYYFQYSPYIYFNEHAIVLSETHRPMHIDHKVLGQLIQLCDMFDGYFFGSNADLPIVGGSILSHDHYQGGKHRFAIEDAKILRSWKIKTLEISILKWPLSTLRLKTTDPALLLKWASLILDKWRDYQQPSLHIFSHTGAQPHNTVTPIARKTGDVYELDLILRNNLTTDEYPLGIFHPHQDKWHIKKENIGLIEAMGLAILPARLESEIESIKNYLLDQYSLSYVDEKHQLWAKTMKADQKIDPNHLDHKIELEIGTIFTRVLEDCGVFKQDDQGIRAFIEFVEENVI